MNRKLHILLLFITTLIWGSTFVAQRIGADYVGPWTYLAGRSWIAVVFLTPLIHIFDRINEARGLDTRRPATPRDRRILLIGGICCGASLCLASAAQQIGIASTTASKAGFITALYVIFVPVFSVFLKKRPPVKIWFCTGIALVGMYLLCMKAESFRLESGDAWELTCAFLFAVEIMFVDYFSPQVNGIRLSRLQFLVFALMSTVMMLFSEQPDLADLRSALPSILYAGVFSSGIAYTLQIIGQEGVNPSLASLIMSLESVFSAMTAWLVLRERMSARELLGAVVMFVAIILAQLSPSSLRRKN
ncbi:MAG: DMT family transporter [Oscillospiraceae bacterium]|nr:DMT family transporter [Oscillospiraceae bacterium]